MIEITNVLAVIGQKELVMYVSQLATGIYFVEVNDGEQMQVKKVVIVQ